MVFWGILLESGKPVTVSFHNVPRRRLRVSHATMEYRTNLHLDERSRPTKLFCQIGNNAAIAVCSLREIKKEMCNLDLEFEGPDDVVFSVSGPHDIHVAGYYLGEPLTKNVIPVIDDWNGGQICTQKQSSLQLAPTEYCQPRAVIDGPTEQKQSSCTEGGLPDVCMAEASQPKLATARIVREVENGEPIHRIPQSGPELNLLEGVSFSQCLLNPTKLLGSGNASLQVEDTNPHEEAAVLDKTTDDGVDAYPVEESDFQRKLDFVILEETMKHSKEAAVEALMLGNDPTGGVEVQISTDKDVDIAKVNSKDETPTEENDIDSGVEVQISEVKQAGGCTDKDGEIGKLNFNDEALSLSTEQNEKDSCKKRKRRHKKSGGNTISGMQDKQEGDTNTELKWKHAVIERFPLSSFDELVVKPSSFETNNAIQPLKDQRLKPKKGKKIKEKAIYADHIEVDKTNVVSSCANEDYEQTSCGKDGTDAAHVPLEIVQQQGEQLNNVDNNDAQLSEEEQSLKPKKKKKKSKEKKTFADDIQVKKDSVVSSSAHGGCIIDSTYAIHLGRELVQQEGEANKSDEGAEAQLSSEHQSRKLKKKKKVISADHLPHQIVQQEGEELNDLNNNDAQHSNELILKTKKKKKRTMGESVAAVERTMQCQENVPAVGLASYSEENIESDYQHGCVQLTTSVIRPKKRKREGKDTCATNEDNNHLKREDVQATASHDDLPEKRKLRPRKRTPVASPSCNADCVAVAERSSSKEINHNYDKPQEDHKEIKKNVTDEPKPKEDYVAEGLNSHGMIVCALSIPAVVPVRKTPKSKLK